MQKYFTCTLVLLGLAVSSVGALTIQAAQNILDELDDMGKVSGEIKPVYRLDLPPTYVAYNMLEDDSDYVLISAGPETGDAQVALRGTLPSPLTDMDAAATAAGKSCDIYLLLIPAGVIACKDANDKIVATTFEDEVLEDIKASEGFTNIHDYIMGKLDDYKKEWEEHRLFILSQQEPDDQSTKRSADEKVISLRQSLATGKSNMEISAIQPGDSRDIAVVEEVTKIAIKYVPQDGESDEFAKAAQVKLCSSIVNCVMKKMTGRIPVEFIVTEPNTNIKKVVLTMKNDTKTILENNEAVFIVEVSSGNNLLVSLAYQLDYPPQTKGYEITGWTSYSYRYLPCPTWVYPRYKNFAIGSCTAGKASVAWGAIFGYYDRRSHSCNPRFGGTRNYRSGPNGWEPGTSSTMRAPYTIDNRMKGYIRKINSINEVNCGRTRSSKMDNIRGFFQARQSGNPDIHSKISSSYYSSWIFTKAQRAWPVLIWMDVNGGWGSRVVVGHKYRTRKRRDCRYNWLGIRTCTSWETLYERYMYVDRLNGPGESPIWYPMKSRYSWAAVH